MTTRLEVPAVPAAPATVLVVERRTLEAAGMSKKGANFANRCAAEFCLE